MDTCIYQHRRDIITFGDSDNVVVAVVVEIVAVVLVNVVVVVVVFKDGWVACEDGDWDAVEVVVVVGALPSSVGVELGVRVVADDGEVWGVGGSGNAGWAGVGDDEDVATIEEVAS